MCKGRNHTPAQKRQRNEAIHCAFCGVKFHKTCKATIEHFYPLTKDAATLNRGWNKVIVCRQCNLGKGNAMPDQYIAYLQKEIDKLTKIKNAVAAYAEKLEGYYIMRDLI